MYLTFVELDVIKCLVVSPPAQAATRTGAAGFSARNLGRKCANRWFAVRGFVPRLRRRSSLWHEGSHSRCIRFRFRLSRVHIPLEPLPCGLGGGK